MASAPGDGGDYAEPMPVGRAPLWGVTGAPLEVLFGAEEGLCGALRARKVQRVKDLVHVPPWELCDWLLVPEAEAEAVLERAWSACAARPLSVWASASRDERRGPGASGVPAPLPSLVGVFRAGLEGSFVEVAGQPGVGKTQFCFQAAALAAARGTDVFWVDTECTFSPQRLLEMLLPLAAEGAGRAQEADGADDLALAALSRVRRHECSSLQELHDIVSSLVHRAVRRECIPGLVVIDSVAFVARNDGAEHRRDSIPKRQALLNAIASSLKMLSSCRSAPAVGGEGEHHIGIVTTNQISSSAGTGAHKVTLGNVWHHAVNWRFLLTQGLARTLRPSSGRQLTIEKSPCVGFLTIPFTVTKDGLREEFADD